MRFAGYITLVFVAYLDVGLSQNTSANIECAMVSNPKTRTFQNLAAYQKNLVSFNPQDDDYLGNFVSFITNNMSSLRKNDFLTKSSQYIMKLSLDNKRISTIEKGAFLYLDCLSFLNLQHNEISNVNDGIFNAMPHLKELDLSYNNIETLPDYLFTGIKRLESVDLSHNRIKAMSKDAFFMKSNSLLTLNLSYNELDSVIPETLANTPQLTVLRLDFNRLDALHPERWNNLDQLKVLNLSHNAITSFDFAYTFCFNTLESLHLDSNSLKKLNVFDFRKNLPQVKFLDINDNRFECDDLKFIVHGFSDSKIGLGGSETSRRNEEGIFCVDEHYVPSTTRAPFVPKTGTPPPSKDNEDYDRMRGDLVSLRSFVAVLSCAVIIAIVGGFVVKSGLGSRFMQYLRDRVHGGHSRIDEVSLLV